MNIKKIALGAAVLALAACNTENAAVSQSTKAAIGPNTTDDQKFAYMLGAQFAGQNFVTIPRQMGEEINVDALSQAILDDVKVRRDTSARLQLPVDTLRAINDRYYSIARNRAMEVRPDSTILAKYENDPDKIRAYVDSVLHAQVIKPADPASGLPMTINGASSENLKLSYLLGVQFGDQLVNIGNSLDLKLEEQYFLLGVKDGAAKLKDSNYVMQLPQDTLQAVGQRYQQKAEAKQAEARKKFEEEQAKLKAEVASLKGDTLANGMPSKFNFTVKATGITNKGTDMSAYSGKPLLVFYFSSTCGHCQHAAPQVFEIAKQFSKSGLTTLAMASGGNNKSGIRKFMDNAKWDDVMNVMWDESRQFGELYSDGYVPKIYLVNPDGTYKLYGSFESEKETLKTEIEALLKGKNVEWKPEAPASEDAAPAAPAAK